MRTELTGRHERAEQQRMLAKSVGATKRLLRWVDDRVQSATCFVDRL